MYKTKTVAKWLEGVKKKTFLDILEKPKRMFKRPTLSTPSVSLSPEVLKKQKILALDMERLKAQALEHIRRSQKW